jgi:hypothetical protein
MLENVKVFFQDFEMEHAPKKVKGNFKHFLS